MEEFDDRLGKLRFGARRKLRLDDVAGHQYRPHPPPARTSNVDGDQTLFRRHQADDRAMFAVAAQRADDSGSLAPHPRG